MIAPALVALALLNGSRPTAPARVAASTIYIVKPGDCLWSIAGRELGNPRRWRVLYDANRYTIGASPDLILPGQKIRVIIRIRDVDPASHAALAVTSGHRERSRRVPPVKHRFAPGPRTGGTPSGTLSCAGLEKLWITAGGRPASAFLAAEIAMAESGGRQYALSPTADYGYWQINASHGPLATFDAMGNARAAVIISGDGSDWQPWVTYVSGAYRGRC